MNKALNLVLNVVRSKPTTIIAHKLIMMLSRVFGFHSVVTLEETYGHYRSHRDWNCANGKNEIIPWFTYPSIEYLSQLDLSSKTMFEFGCGNSSVYFSKRVRHLWSVEDDQTWYEKIKAYNMPNHTIELVKEKRSYLDAIRKAGDKFDIVLIDASYRTDCAQLVSEYVLDGGMVIFDNSNWYPHDCKILRDQGYTQIDFHGFGPIVQYTFTTSIFFKNGSSFKAQNDLQPIEPWDRYPVRRAECNAKLI